MTNALIFRTLERNTGSVGLASELCDETATNIEIQALSQHQVCVLMSSESNHTEFFVHRTLLRTMQRRSTRTSYWSWPDKSLALVETLWTLFNPVPSLLVMSTIPLGKVLPVNSLSECLMLTCHVFIQATRAMTPMTHKAVLSH